MDNAVNRLNQLPLTYDSQVNFNKGDMVRTHLSGFPVGTIESVDTVNGQAMVRVGSDESEMPFTSLCPVGDYQFRVTPYLCSAEFVQRVLDACKIELTDEKPIDWWTQLQCTCVRSGATMYKSAVPGAAVGLFSIGRTSEDATFKQNQLRLKHPSILEVIVDPSDYTGDADPAAHRADIWSMIKMQVNPAVEDMIWNFRNVNQWEELYIDKNKRFEGEGAQLRGKATGNLPLTLSSPTFENILQRACHKKPPTEGHDCVHDQGRLRWLSDCVDTENSSPDGRESTWTTRLCDTGSCPGHLTSILDLSALTWTHTSRHVLSIPNSWTPSETSLSIPLQ